MNSVALEHEIMFVHEVMMTDGLPNGYMVNVFEITAVEPDGAVEMLDEEHTEGDEHSEDEEHSVGDDHTEEDEHMEDEHAQSGFMVKVPVSHDIYTMSFTITEDMAGEWEI